MRSDRLAKKLLRLSLQSHVYTGLADYNTVKFAIKQTNKYSFLKSQNYNTDSHPTSLIPPFPQHIPPVVCAGPVMNQDFY